MSFIDPEYEYHEFYLDSSDATNSISTSISKLNWPQFNLATPLKDVVSFKVLEAQIPISYCVPAGGSFVINYYDIFTVGSPPSSPAVSFTVTLPSTGAPSGAQIASFISTQLNDNHPFDLIPQPTGWASGEYVECQFVPSASSATGLPYFKFILHSNSAGVTSNNDFSITVSDQRSEDLLGFPIGTTFDVQFNTVFVGKRFVDSPRPALITGSPYLYIASNAVGNNCKTYLPLGATLLGGGVSSPQFAKVPVSNVVQGQWLVWQDANQSWFDCDNIATLSQMDIFVQLGNYGGYIDFQGLPFSIKLGILVKRQTSSANHFGGAFVGVRQR